MPVIKNIIFDLGGVILNIDFKKTEHAFENLGITNFAQYMTQFRITSFFEEFEIGKIDIPTFIKKVQELSVNPLAENEIINAWNALLLNFPEDRIDFLKKIKHQYRIFLLSNTNALHYNAFQEQFYQLTGGYLESIFEKTYYSQKVGMRKPYAEIYKLVVTENVLNPAETLFIDDTANNFAGAIETGLQIFHLQSPVTIMEMPIFHNLK